SACRPIAATRGGDWRTSGAARTRSAARPGSTAAPAARSSRCTYRCPEPVRRALTAIARPEAWSRCGRRARRPIPRRRLHRGSSEWKNRRWRATEKRVMVTRVLIVEDEPTFQRRLSEAVQADPQLHLLALVSSGAAAKALLDAQAPDVMLVDLGLPDVDGLDVIRHAARHRPACDVMVVTVFGDEAHLMASIAAGATGYLLKDASDERIAAAIHELRAGGAPISPGLARRVLAHLRVGHEAGADRPRAPRAGAPARRPRSGVWRPGCRRAGGPEPGGARAAGSRPPPRPLRSSGAPARAGHARRCAPCPARGALGRGVGGGVAGVAARRVGRRPPTAGRDAGVSLRFGAPPGELGRG